MSTPPVFTGCRGGLNLQKSMIISLVFEVYICILYMYIFFVLVSINEYLYWEMNSRLLLGWGNLGAWKEIHIAGHFPGCNYQGGVVGLLLNSSIVLHSKISQHISPCHKLGIVGKTFLWTAETYDPFLFFELYCFYISFLYFVFLFFLLKAKQQLNYPVVSLVVTMEEELQELRELVVQLKADNERLLVPTLVLHTLPRLHNTLPQATNSYYAWSQGWGNWMGAWESSMWHKGPKWLCPFHYRPSVCNPGSCT